MTKLLRLRTLKNILFLISLVVTSTQCADRTKHTNNDLLFFACLWGDTKQVRSLLEQKASVNTSYHFRVGLDSHQPIQKGTPLGVAVGNCHHDIVRILLENNADPNFSGLTKFPPITVASIYGNVSAVDALLQAGADPNCLDKFGGTAVIAASDNGHKPIVEKLLEAGAHVNHKIKKLWGTTACIQAAEKGHGDVLQVLLDAKAHINQPCTDGSTALSRATINRHYAVVKKLLLAGAYTKRRDNANKYPVEYAKNDRMKELFVLYARDKSQFPSVQDARISTLLVQQDKNIKTMLPQYPKNKQYLLHQAIQDRHFETLKFFLDNQADPNETEPQSGITPLLVASFKGCTQFAIVLLQAKADPNQVTVDGVSPVMVACERGHYSVAKKLLYARALVNQQENTFGITALTQAAQEGYGRLIKLLLKWKADVNLARKDGITPSHIAAHNDHLWATQFLVNAGAQIDVRDKYDKRPIDYAKFEPVKQLLLQSKSEQSSE